MGPRGGRALRSRSRRQLTPPDGAIDRFQVRRDYDGLADTHPGEFGRMPETRRAFRLPSVSARGRFWLILVAGILLVYSLAGFFLVPWILHRQLRTQASVYLHREATLAKARFNPFTLKTTLIGYDLRDLDGSRLLAFDTMVVNLSTA